MNRIMKHLFWIAVLACAGNGLSAQHLHHRIYASIDHTANEISVTDTLVIPPGLPEGTGSLTFTLNGNLSMEPPAGECRIEKQGMAGHPGTEQYRIAFPRAGKGETELPLRYHGKIHEEIVSGAVEYARGFSETGGIICSDGIYLAGSSEWVPAVEDTDLFTFDLTVEVDRNWNVVSQGTRTVNEVTGDRRRVEYSCADPMEEVYLVAGPWTEYSVQSGGILIQAFLRTPDQELADRYLGVTRQYLDLYQGLIGTYPYTKFALVENFWETGFGMPSFTLLGGQVIRFPWILHSSYPHELLHNWWGNSVFVDYSKGNWCEGITAYMADHLIREQQGTAEVYRRNTLQKFTDYVNEENDFPPAEFVSRNNPAEEAIGYGKVLMFNEMLRSELGDEAFLKAYADFYGRNRFRFASFDDIRASFERVTGKDLKPFFDQWINRTGAPELKIQRGMTSSTGGKWKISFKLMQVQEGELFHLSVPVVIYLEKQEELFRTRVELSERLDTYTFQFDKRPLKISVDPQFNMMRILDRSEVPSSLTQLFGADTALMILPGKSDLKAEYEKLGQLWKETQAAQGKELRIVSDGGLTQVPSDMPVWVLGYENLYSGRLGIIDRARKLLPEEERGKMDSLRMDGNSLIFALPGNPGSGQTTGFIGTGNPEAVKGLATKLLHYGSYSYLGFGGDAPDNVLKGNFPVLKSSLDYVVAYPDRPAITQKLESRQALDCNLRKEK
jgi:aminopeptidase N